jgi:tripartite-type tricarboxylate transporter receptor subunit TctC
MRSIIRSTCLVLAALGFASPAVAQDANYPNRAIELVVPFPAGGATDVIARLAAQSVSEKIGQPVVVQNKAGATGAIGSEYVARAAPDGYTLLVATASTHAVLPAYRSDLSYDTVTSFETATLLATFPNLLVVNPKKVQAKTVAELIALAKSKPGQLNFASSGPGSSIHFAGELFKLMTGTEMVHVPYRGSAPALNDLLAGNVDLIFDNITTVWPQAQQGNLRALGVASLKRSPLVPEVPAIAETVPGFEARSWVGVVAPAKTPSAVVQKISDLFGAAMRNPELVKKLADLGADATTNAPAEFKTFLINDRTRWQKLSDQANLRAK